MTDRKDWPEWSAHQRQEMLKSVARIQRCIAESLDISFRGERNTTILKEATLFIETQAQRIIVQCRVARHQRPDGLRWPRWALYALDQIPFEADAIMECVARSEAHREAMRFETVGTYLKIISMKTSVIELLLHGAEVIDLEENIAQAMESLENQQ